VVNDQREQLTAQFVYEAFNCKASCISLTGELRFDMTVAGLSAMEIVDPTYLRSMVLGDNVAIDVYENLVDRSRIVNSSTGAVIYETVRLGRKVIQAADRDLGTVAIGTVTGSGYQYEIELIANGFAPLIWLDLSESLPGWFNDNAFTMLDGRRTVMFTLDRLINRTLTAHDFTVCSLKDCGMFTTTGVVTTTGTIATTNVQTDSTTSSAHILLPTSGILTLTVLFLRFCF